MHGCPFFPTDWWRKSISQNSGRNSGWLTGILVFFHQKIWLLGLGGCESRVGNGGWWAMLCLRVRVGPCWLAIIGAVGLTSLLGIMSVHHGDSLNQAVFAEMGRGIFSIFHGSSILTHTHNKTVLVSWNLRILGGEKIRKWISYGPGFSGDRLRQGAFSSRRYTVETHRPDS